MRICIAMALALAGPATLAGQWTLTSEVGLTAFSGSARDSSGLRVGPTRATVLGLRFGRESRNSGIGLRILTGSSGFGATDGDLTVIPEHQLRPVEVAGFFSWQLGQIGTASRLGFAAGPVFDGWMPQGATSRSRFGRGAARA